MWLFARYYQQRFVILRYLVTHRILFLKLSILLYMTSSSFKPEFSETNLQFAAQNKQIYALLICLGKNKCICETVTYYSVENITNKYVKMRNFLQ